MWALRRASSDVRRAAPPPRATLKEFVTGDRGAALVEFAFAGPIIITMLMGIIEVSMVVFMNLMVEAGVRDASRFGLTGAEIEGYTREEYIVELVNERTMGLLNITSENIDVRVYETFAEIQEAEPFVDANTNGDYDEGEIFNDLNGNEIWDGDPGTPGAGSSDDIVVYRVSANWAILTSYLADLLGDDGLFTITSSIAVRNEPWDVGS